MALNIIPIIKFLSQSKAVTETVSSLIKQFKSVKTENTSLIEMQKALAIQAEINEKLETQIKNLQSGLENINKAIKVITILVYVSIILAVSSLVLFFIQ